MGLITRSERNPYFLVLRRSAQEEAQRQGLQLLHEAPNGPEGDQGGEADSVAQAAAMQRLLAAGVRVILITPSDSRALVPAIRRARARGVLVIAIDTPTEPPAAVDATISSDNRNAGRLIGAYARAAWAARATGRPARIAVLDLFAGNAVSDQRRLGFLEGFGLTGTAAAAKAGGSVACQADTSGNRSRGEAAMRACLAAAGRIPFDVVYAVNEPAAAGAATALESASPAAQRTILVTVDGSCLGVRAVADGIFAATAQQYPTAMATAAITAAADWLRHGRRPEASIISGVSLVTARPQAGVPAIDLKDGLAACWGGIPDTAEGRPLLVYPENRRTVERVEIAAAELSRRGEAALAALQQRNAGRRDAEADLFVLDAQGNRLLDPIDSPSRQLEAPAAQQRIRQRFLEIGDSPLGRGWVHYRIAAPAGGPARWASTYLMRTVTPQGRRLLVGSGSHDSRIENAFIVEEVEAAAELLRRRGRAAFAALRDPDGRSMFRDVYVFVDDSTGTELVNPAFPELEGRNLVDLRDAEGKEVVRDQLLQALRNGSGWSSSLWPRPGSRLPVRKLTYVRQVVTPEGETLVVGAGVYETPVPAASPRR